MCGSSRDPFTLTKLLQLYVDCDDLDSAQNLFDKLPQPNVFAWSSILAFYSRHGSYEECLHSYRDMKVKGVSPDNYVFPQVLRACAQSSSLEEGIQIHKHVIVYGSELNLQVCNSLIDMYAKCGDVESARRVFDEMVEKDLLSWNSMISGYVHNGLLRLAVQLFSSVRANGCEPDIVTFNTVLDAYCRMGLCEEAWKIFGQIKDPNIISWTTLISGYSRTGKHEIALRKFRTMVNMGRVFPDLGSLSSVLVSCRHLGALMSGREIHGYGTKMERGTKFYSSAGPALLTMYTKCHRIQDAKTVFGLMDKSDVVTWNSMILGFSDVQLGHMALECFSQLQKTGVKNDQTTISTILPVCDIKSGKQIHARMIRNSFCSVVVVLNALIHMYSKCGCVGYAYSVFCNMFIRDLVSWNAMIGGFAMHGLGQAALHLLEQMNQSGFSPNSVTLTSALSACTHGGLVDEGIELFHRMTKEVGLIPSIEHCACVVDMLARAGRIEDAVSFIQAMPLEPDKSIWGAVLAACKAHQNVGIGKLAAEQLIRLEPEQAGHYVTLSNIYARAGKWEDVAEVRKELGGRGMGKQAGQSWIES